MQNPNQELQGWGREPDHTKTCLLVFTLDNLFPSGYSHQRGPGLNAGRLIFLRRSQCCRDWGPCSWEEGLRGFASRHALLSPLTSNCLLTRL